MRVNLLLDSSRIGIVYDPVGFLISSELGLPLGSLIYSDTWTLVGLQLIVYIPTGSKVRYLDLMDSPSRTTLEVNPSVHFSKFPLPLSVTCLTSPS